jgi:Uncharacterised protein conserved in bacteria (DUF2336)
MMANPPADILSELEAAVAACPAERCHRILCGLLQLLNCSRDTRQAMLANVVDGVLLRLTERVAADALIELSHVLSGLDAAPPETLRRLARHADPEIACAILLRSTALSPHDLATIARSGSERHQFAIAARHQIEPAVTEVLIGRGHRALCLALINNPGARFSESAYAALLAIGKQDEEITRALALRPGTPDHIVRKLLSVSPGGKAQAKPTASAAPPESGTDVVKRPSPADYASARPEIVALNRVGKLNDSTVNRFAIRGETANLWTALSVLSGAPIEIVEHVMSDEDCEGLVMACRASRLNWATTLAILSNRGGPRLSFAARERAQQIFENLLLSTSQWTVRWGEIAANARPDDVGQRGGK